MTKKIYHVDDSGDVRTTVRMIIEAETDYELLSFSDAESMYTAINATKPDLVILDIMIEEVGSGLKAYDQLRESHPDIAILILSSLGDMILPYIENRNETPWILDKPVIPEKLLGSLRLKLQA